jgi:uncharacterized protein YndB with AHSA1/START domain
MKSNQVASREAALNARSGDTTESAERVLEIERIFDAPPSLVFKAWTEPQHLARWFGPRGFTLSSCKLDLRPGGAWRYCMLSSEGREHWVRGVFREIVEPKLLVFTWAHENEGGVLGHETVITVTFAEQGEKTKLTLRQAVFETVEDCDAHRGGWNSSFECLAEYLANA